MSKARDLKHKMLGRLKIDRDCCDGFSFEELVGMMRRKQPQCGMAIFVEEIAALADMYVESSRADYNVDRNRAAKARFVEMSRLARAEADRLDKLPEDKTGGENCDDFFKQLIRRSLGAALPTCLHQWEQMTVSSPNGTYHLHCVKCGDIKIISGT